VRGAKPLYLTCGFVLEEGLDMEVLERVAVSLARAAEAAGVSVVAGDTKVVGRGQADKIFINTTGIGVIPEGVDVGAHRVRSGDVVLVSGAMGDHGVTILASRESLGLDTGLRSDSAALNGMIADLLEAVPQVHAMRDPTRGGLATTLNEIAASAGVALELDEAAIPVDQRVAGACELLGLDPLYLANEGKLIVFVPAEQAEDAVAVLKGHPLGGSAAIIGRALPEPGGRVFLKTAVGGRRILDMLTGEPLPRIC
jgi:hydrogenase expression/formation protein HypE